MYTESCGLNRRFGICVSSSDARTTVVESTIRDGTSNLKNVRREGTPPTPIRPAGVTVFPLTTMVIVGQRSGQEGLVDGRVRTPV